QPEEKPRPAPRQIFQERQRITGLPLYLQGYLSARNSGCKEFRVYWTELRGTMLFFYDDKRAPKYSQKLDISALISATSLHPDGNSSAQFNLMLPNGEVELKANDYECGKEWKDFILTVTKLSVPSDESLLPGQLTRMHEVLEREKKRRITLNNSCSTSLRSSGPQTTMPACFHAVSRQEAAELLAKNPSRGNLILRPSSDSKSYTVTARYDLGAPSIKHYRVLAKETSYSIELERKVTLPSLQDVVNYFVTQTQGNLKPFVMQT
ncbi:STAP1 protein, partial [Semnornis frantzii]|nr:STAP1 protein [Semnornis frantzii]